MQIRNRHHDSHKENPDKELSLRISSLPDLCLYNVPRISVRLPHQRERIEKTHDIAAFTVIKSPAKQALEKFALARQQFDLVFLDPPYAKETLRGDMRYMAENQLLAPQAIILVESDDDANLPQEDQNFMIIQQKHYGITVVTIYRYQAND